MSFGGGLRLFFFVFQPVLFCPAADLICVELVFILRNENWQPKNSKETKSRVTHSPLTHSLQYRILHGMDVRKKIGLRIKELREKKGISQFEFSLRCELDRTYINGIENGRRNVSIVNIEKIAKSFGLTLKEFFNSKLFTE